ncbi:MAG: hypothetical protein ACYC4B_29685 [Pirellulaceae bacterium]
MGFFDWLTGAKAKVRTDNRIWLTKQAKFAGIQRDIAQALADPNGPDAVFVVAHFQDCLDELRSLVASAGFDEGHILVTLSEALERRTAGAASDESQRILFVIGERHPLQSHDDALQDFARGLSCQCRLVQHASLDDPLLRLFAGEWVEKVLRQLGMNEDEFIESQMVTRRIRAAQQKIEDRATPNYPAQSAQEWLEKNCPSM